MTHLANKVKETQQPLRNQPGQNRCFENTQFIQQTVASNLSKITIDQVPN